jgi:hypothetical protein
MHFVMGFEQGTAIKRAVGAVSNFCDEVYARKTYRWV